MRRVAHGCLSWAFKVPGVRPGRSYAVRVICKPLPLVTDTRFKIEPKPALESLPAIFNTPPTCPGQPEPPILSSKEKRELTVVALVVCCFTSHSMAVRFDFRRTSIKHANMDLQSWCVDVNDHAYGTCMPILHFSFPLLSTYFPCMPFPAILIP
jgi:hypothetical protein